ncbi:MAG TPA: RecX family transcriptional regulator [Gammaproteobacteria bacterium]|mgnify:CR=1 FL=1|nr:RecX family transcriptional regulator [Gammaproteobacteria bacterium]|tara:strand:- start:564 stop:1034 length:471 start_codon:yes stop_codon:yes gene_type:complete
MIDGMADPRVQVRDKALSLLVRREHSRGELQEKLIQRGFKRSLVDQVLDELCARNELSDVRYAQALISHRAKAGYGPAYIRQELRKRNVAPEIIDSLLVEVEVSWIEIASAKHSSRFPDPVIQDYRDWARRASYLQRRGFDTDTICQVLGEWQSPG